jgi:hypothetical protein
MASVDLCTLTGGFRKEKVCSFISIYIYII